MPDSSSSAPLKKGVDLPDKHPAPFKGTNHLLVIAIDDYQHVPPLNNCVRDAQGLIEVLTRNYTFAPERVQSLFNQEATGEQIIRTLEALPQKFEKDDNLVIFFSGHGEYRNPQEEGFWVPVDARRGVTKDRISVPELKMYLNPLPCHHLILIVDACFSGSIFKRYRSSAKLAAKLSATSRWGLTSGRLEPVLDGRPGMHSPFAESLIKQLGANLEPMRLDQLYANIEEDLRQLGFEEQAPDSGYLDLSGNKRGMFFLHPKVIQAPEKEAIDFKIKIENSVLHILEANIVAIQADAVVSSDDTQLTMGGGVSAAIGEAAGQRLRDFVKKFRAAPAPVGTVVETAAFDLPANYIFHAITLDRHSRQIADDQAIAAMTRQCLELAEERQLRHIVFPALGTGTAGADFESTARAMIDTICRFLGRGSTVEQVTIALYSRNSGMQQKGMRAFYQKAIQQGAAWAKLNRYQEELPEILRLLGKEKRIRALLDPLDRLLEQKQD